jgi:YVTN family beta-propeller protein
MSFTALAITPDGRKVLAVNLRGFPSPPDSTVAVIETQTNTVAASVTVGHIPFGIATQPTKKRRQGGPR